MFLNLSYNASISELYIDRNRLRPQGQVECDIDSMSVFFDVNQCLKSTSLAQCGLGDSGVLQICTGLKRNSSLGFLDLSNNEIADEGAGQLAAAWQDGKTRLTHLNLSDNRITDTGALKLAHACRYLQPQQRTIVELNLMNNMIGADGAFYLGE